MKWAGSRSERGGRPLQARGRRHVAPLAGRHPPQQRLQPRELLGDAEVAVPEGLGVRLPGAGRRCPPGRPAGRSSSRSRPGRCRRRWCAGRARAPPAARSAPRSPAAIASAAGVRLDGGVRGERGQVGPAGSGRPPCTAPSTSGLNGEAASAWAKFSARGPGRLAAQRLLDRDADALDEVDDVVGVLRSARCTGPLPPPPARSAGAGLESPGAQAGTLRKAIASASLACPAGVACARAAALFSVGRGRRARCRRRARPAGSSGCRAAARWRTRRRSGTGSG